MAKRRGTGMKRPAFGALLALPSLIWAALAVPQAHAVEFLASTDEVTIIQDGDWTNYEYSKPLQNSTKHSYRGKSDGQGGCTFNAEEVVLPGDVSPNTVIHEREVSTNTKSCVMKTEKGIDETATTTQGEVVSADEQLQVDQPTVVNDPSEGTATPSTEVTTLATYYRSAWHRTYFEDPPGWDVNSAKTRVSWSYNYYCVLDSWNHGTYYTWLWQTGWYKDYSSTTAGRSCYYARTTSNSKFVNWPFCISFLSTTTKYEPNQIRGRWDGAYVMNWWWYKGGDCSSLLSFHRSHGYS